MRVRDPLLVPWFCRSVLTIIGVWMAFFHWGASKVITGAGPGPLRDLSLHEVVIQYASVGMLAASVCAILRLPRWVFAACAAFAALVLGLAVYAATRHGGIGLIYAVYAIVNAAGFVALSFGLSAQSSGHQYGEDHRQWSPLPGLAFILSVLASPVGLFFAALFAIADDFPTQSEVKILARIFLVALPITSFVFSASVWCHLDRNADRLQGRPLASVAWVISSLSMVVAILVGIELSI